ncbi:MAG: tRNA uridine-5-carboxymethylaminomethyl(34) synthesis GTPase MnmE [Bacteroidota bacterium]
MKSQDDVIAAIATPIGEGGISVIRLSGNGAFEVADRGFRGKVRLSEARTHTAHFGHMIDQSGEVLDEVVAVVFRGPHSYTAEDVVELSCHGGLWITRTVLDAVIANGGRLAEPGEFTKRAFLNGRIDLSQAEAVADLIRARTDLAHRSSLHQLEGKLSESINVVRNELIEMCGLLELELDFVEEDIEFLDKPTLARRLSSVIVKIDLLIQSYSFGKVCREGIKVVLSGNTNVGKSSLLNALLNENRAIVTEIPGTTRDVIEENLNIDGVLFRVVDTAGLRETVDIVEQEGVRRSENQILSCDILVLVFDASQPVGEPDRVLIERILGKIDSKQTGCLVVQNKMDLVSNGQSDGVLQFLSRYRRVNISALTGMGLDDVRREFVKLALGGRTDSSEGTVTVTNSRHKQALEKARDHLRLALRSIEERQSGEFVAVDLRSALDFLGEIVGTVTTEDILNSIFSKFCIGK